MNTPGITKIGQIAITVKDVARAEAFYRDVVGLKHLFSAGPNLSFFDCDGTRIMLGVTEPGQPETGSSILYFKVEDIEAAFERFQAQGVTIVHEPRFVAKMPDHDLWLGFFKDSEGNTMSLMAEKR